jgi:hypothetical protein
VVSVGPALCAYRYTVTSGFLLGAGTGAKRVTGVAVVQKPNVVLRLLPRDEGSTACPLDDCGFTCFVSGLSGLAAAAEGAAPKLVGVSNDGECECAVLEGKISPDLSTYTAGDWQLTADTGTNSIVFTYAGAVGCEGSFDVQEGQTFLGIPVPNVVVEESNSTGVTAVTVEQAEAAAAALTAGTAVAVGAAVGAAVGGTVGGAVAGAAGEQDCNFVEDVGDGVGGDGVNDKGDDQMISGT